MHRIMLDSALYPNVGDKQEYAYVYMLKLPTCMDGNNPTYKKSTCFVGMQHQGAKNTHGIKTHIALRSCSSQPTSYH